MVVLKVFLMLLCPILSIQNENIDLLKSILKNFNMKNVIFVNDGNFKTSHLFMKEMFVENQFSQTFNNIRDFSLKKRESFHDIMIYITDIDDINDHLSLIIKSSLSLIFITCTMTSKVRTISSN